MYKPDTAKPTPWDHVTDETLRYENKYGIHDCQSKEIHHGILLIWTKCGLDVPANMAFRPSKYVDDKVTCVKCAKHGERV